MPSQAARMHTRRARQRDKSGRRLAPQSGVDSDSLQLNHAASRGSSDGFSAADNVHFGEDAFHV